MTMIVASDFNPDKVRKLMQHDKILDRAYKKQTKGKTGGHVEVLRSIFNALIKPDRRLMEEYQKINV